MELSDYRYFDHLAQTMHFARTARALGMSPSALTRRVKAMEETLGQQLLLREHREIRLTKAGERFRAFARLQIEQWEELQNELREDVAEPTGELHIACTVTACHSVLPRLLSDFRKAYPKIRLRLITQDATRSLHQLEAGEVDLAVIPTEGDAPQALARSVLGTTEFSFIAPQAFEELPGLERFPYDLSDTPFVVPIGGLERQRLFAWFKTQRLDPHVVAEVRGNEGIIAMVSLGSGVGLVPRLVLESSPLRDKVKELSQLSPPQGYDVSLCTRRRNLGRRVVQLFWELSDSESS